MNYLTQGREVDQERENVLPIMSCQPADWECELYSKVKPTLEEGQKTDSSYYRLVEEQLRKCEKTKEQKDG